MGKEEAGGRPVLSGWHRAEGGLVALAALPLAVLTDPGWPLWLWPLLLLAPDLGALGYLGGRRAGALCYNLAHLYAGGLLLALFGLVTGETGLIAAGAVWLAHIGADRALGYGFQRVGQGGGR